LKAISGQSALDQAFTTPPLSESTPPLAAAASIEIKSSEDQHLHTAEVVDGSTTHTTSNLEDTWRAEYEAQVQSWRAQSAEAREKAEKERLRWESVRANEKEEANITDEPPKSEVHPFGESSNTITSADTTTSSNTVSSSETDFGRVSFLRCQVKI
jgi:hypothetical protein